MLQTEVLMFSTVLYVVDDPANVDSLSTAIYMSTVTVTTVGYGTAPRWLGEGLRGTEWGKIPGKLQSFSFSNLDMDPWMLSCLLHSGAFQTLTDACKFRDYQTKSNNKVYTCIV